MSVWISDEKLLIFVSLISPSKMILFEKKYQTFDTVFHHQMKHLEVRQKYSAVRRIFNSLLGVSSGDETLHLMFDILLISWLHLWSARVCVAWSCEKRLKQFFFNASLSLDNRDRQTHTICVTFELSARMDGSNNNVFYASLQSPFFLIFTI